MQINQKQNQKTSLNDPPQDQMTKRFGPSVRVCHLSIKGIIQANNEYLSKLLSDNYIIVILIQETYAQIRKTRLREVESMVTILWLLHARGYTKLPST